MEDVDVTAILNEEEEDDLEDFDLEDFEEDDEPLPDFEDVAPAPVAGVGTHTGVGADGVGGMEMDVEASAKVSGSERADEREIREDDGEVTAPTEEGGEGGGRSALRHEDLEAHAVTAGMKRVRDDTRMAEADGSDERRGNTSAARSRGAVAEDGWGEGGDVDVEMRDQHTFVPLEPEEVKLVEHICRKVNEPKKHLVRLLVKNFGAALASGALKETEGIEKNGGSFYEADGQPPRRRSAGGVFIMVMKRRAPSKDFKRVMDESKEIDKLLKRQKGRDNPHHLPPGKKPRTAGAPTCGSRGFVVVEQNGSRCTPRDGSVAHATREGREGHGIGTNRAWTGGPSGWGEARSGGRGGQRGGGEGGGRERHGRGGHAGAGGRSSAGLRR